MSLFSVVRAVLVVALGAIQLASCTSKRRIDLDADEAALVVLAVQDASGRISRVARGSGREGIDLDFEAGARLYIFTMPPGSLVDAAGEPLSNAFTSEVEVVLRGDPARGGACGRCLVPAVTAPAVVLPGDRCAVPITAQVEVYSLDEAPPVRVEDPEAVNAVRREVELAWPGACACVPPPAEPAKPLVLCPLLPLGAPIGPSHAAIAEDGTVLAEVGGFSISVRPDGITSTRQAESTPGRISAVASLPGTSEFLVATRGPRRQRSDVIYERVGADLSRIRLVSVPPLQPVRIKSLEDDDSLYLLGEIDDGLSQAPAVMKCSFGGGGTASCRSEPLLLQRDRCADAKVGTIVDAALLASGDAVAASNSGEMFLRAAGQAAWYCDPNGDNPPMVFEDISTTLDQIVSVFAWGQRVFVCGRFETFEEVHIGHGVATATIAPIVLEAGGAPMNLTHRYAVSTRVNSPCGDFALVEGGTRLRLTTTGGSAAYDFDAEGRLVAEHPGVGSGEGTVGALLAEVPEAIERLSLTRSGFVLAQTDRHNLYRAAPGSAAMPIWAPAVPNQHDVTAFAALSDGQVIAFEPHTGAVRIGRGAGGGCEGVTYAPISIPGRLGGLEYDVAAADPAAPDRRVVLISRDEDAFARARFVDLVAEREVGSVILAPNSLLQFVGIAALGPNQFLIVRADGALLELRGDSVAQLDPIWDDPTTDAIEVQPLSDPGRNFWHSVTVSSGIGWVTGHGVLARVLPGTQTAPSRVEAFWLQRAESDLYRAVVRATASPFTSAKAVCPDHLVLVVKEQILESPLGVEQDEHHPWVLTHALNGDLTLKPFEPFVAEGEGAARSTAVPLGVLGGGARLTHVFNDGTIQRPGAPRKGTPFPRMSGAAESGGIMVFGGRGGRVTVGVEAP